MAEKFVPRESATPGQRTVISLDVGLLSLPALLKGIDAHRCWLTDKGDGTYVFHATQRLGDSRKEPGTPAADLLIDMLNEFGALLDKDDVPRWLSEAWDQMVESYIAATADATNPEKGTGR